MRYRGILLLVGLVLVLVAPIEAAGWREVARMSVPRSEHAGAVINGRIYVIGGYGVDASDGTSPRVLEMYTRNTNKWTRLPDFPENGRHHLMVVAYNNKLYVFGGRYVLYNPALSARVPFVYDPATRTWTRLAKMPQNRHAGAAVVIGQYIYIVGGASIDNPTTLPTYRYDPANNTWKTLAAPPTSRNHVAAVTFQGKIWLMGGRESHVTDYNLVEIYNPTTDTWSTGPALNHVRGGFGAAVLDKKIYVVGGEVVGSCTAQPCTTSTIEPTMEMYDPAVGAWQVISTMPLPLHGFPLLKLQGELYVVGGSMTASGINNAGRVFVYTP